jgi:DNA-binding transcriptional LysR family regulator
VDRPTPLRIPAAASIDIPAVAEELHFSKAADRLHVAQSAVSAQIQQLEASLGAALFHRSKRSSVMLTDAGLLFLTEARSALRQVENAESIGRLAGRGMLGHIEIGYVASAAFSGLLSSSREEFGLVLHRLGRLGFERFGDLRVQLLPGAAQ